MPHNSFGRLRWLLGLGVITTVSVTPAAAVTMYAVRSPNDLVRFDSATPGTIDSTAPVTGLVAGDSIVGIDVRPATGQLYALGVTGGGSTAHLYTLAPATALATQVGGNIALPQSAGASGGGTTFGFDFNPVSDRIRVTGILKDNFSLDPDTGAAVADTALSVSFIAGAAYDRNVPGLGVTTLFGINSGASDALVLQGGVNGAPSPNGGVIATIGPLGVDTSVLVGFDIASPTQGGTAFAALFTSATGTSGLNTIDLTTGAATLIGPIGTGQPTVDALAIALPSASTPAPALSRHGLVLAALLLLAFGGLQLNARRRH